MTKQKENGVAVICNAVFVRSEADSNRCTRFCRPLPSHSAIRPKFYPSSPRQSGGIVSNLALTPPPVDLPSPPSSLAGTPLRPGCSALPVNRFVLPAAYLRAFGCANIGRFIFITKKKSIFTSEKLKGFLIITHKSPSDG